MAARSLHMPWKVRLFWITYFIVGTLVGIQILEDFTR
jgi:hypothetical protein